MMMLTSTSETEISTYYSTDYRLKATVIRGDECYFVDFYKDDVIIDSRRIEGKSLRYVEDIAENFVNGIIQIDPHTWRLNDSV